jgi:hypothetical protein
MCERLEGERVSVGFNRVGERLATAPFQIHILVLLWREIGLHLQGDLRYSSLRVVDRHRRMNPVETG